MRGGTGFLPFLSFFLGEVFSDLTFFSFFLGEVVSGFFSFFNLRGGRGSERNERFVDSLLRFFVESSPSCLGLGTFCFLMVLGGSVFVDCNGPFIQVGIILGAVSSSEVSSLKYRVNFIQELAFSPNGLPNGGTQKKVQPRL